MNYLIIPGLKTRNGIKLVHAKDKTFDLVKEAILDHFGMTFEKVSRRCRKREILYPRQIFIYLLKQNTTMSLKQIGDIFEFDHTTVIHSIQKVKDLMDTEDEIRHEVRVIQASI